MTPTDQISRPEALKVVAMVVTATPLAAPAAASARTIPMAAQDALEELKEVAMAVEHRAVAMEAIPMTRPSAPAVV